MKRVIHHFQNIIAAGKSLWNVFVLLAIPFLVLTSCKEDITEPTVEGKIPELTASVQEVILKQNKANDQAVDFNWTAASNYGTNAAIEYSLEFATSESGFENPLSLKQGKAVYSTSFKVGDFNNLLRNELQLSTGTSSEIQVRVKAQTLAEEIEADYSDTLRLTVTPFEPVSTTLYMIGDAAPNGWDAANATEMSADPADPTSFSTNVQLKPGEFKFITTLGEFLPSYNKGASENELVYRTEDAQPDDKFSVTEAGLYNVTVNLAELTITTEQLEGPPYNQLWVIGSAAPKGWDLDNADEMTQSEDDGFIFTYSAVLNAGEFKIATAKDWGAAFYRPTEADAPISSTEVQLSAGDPDHKWAIAEAGYYKVTLNLREMTISFDAIDLYMIGDAGPNGWDIGNPSPMTKNGAVYTYSGPLTAGELKIAKFKGDWCDGEWINAASPDQAITDTNFITTQACDGPDNKWRVTDATAGDYTITIDLSSNSMTVEAL